MNKITRDFMLDVRKKKKTHMNMNILNIAVDNIPIKCSKCIFESKEEYRCIDDVTFGDGIIYNCYLKVWIKNQQWENGIYNCPCPLDGKIKNHYVDR